MSEQRLHAAIEFPDWNTADQQRGVRHATQLAEFAAQKPVQWSADAPRSFVTRIGICGAGVMGTAIAATNLRHGISVDLYDASREAADRAADWLRADTAWHRAPFPATAPASTIPPPTLRICRQLDELADAPLIVETVVENREIKQRILSQLGGKAPATALLATNTSTIRLSDLASTVPNPGRFCGLHFCNPVAHRRLVEIVCGPQTSRATVAAALQYVVQIGKLPIVVRDSPGFLVNRLLLPYLNEALEMVCQGAPLQQLDLAARQFGMAVGPIEMFDLIGIDTAMWAGRTLWEAFADRTALTPILPALVKRGRLGQKTGRGFYRYPEPDGPGAIDPDLPPILAPYLRRTQSFTTQEISVRLFLPMLVEAARALEDGIVGDVRDIDLGTLYGLAFPPTRGGLMFWANRVGAKEILHLLQPLLPLGKRMQPTQWLHTIAQSGGTFYDANALTA